MPISLKDLQENTRTLVVEYDTEKVTVVYRPGVITPSSGDDFAKNGVVDQLEKLLLSWDVLDDKGKPAPVTKELLTLLPARFLAHIADAISGDMRPNARRVVT